MKVDSSNQAYIILLHFSLFVTWIIRAWRIVYMICDLYSLLKFSIYT